MPVDAFSSLRSHLNDIDALVKGIENDIQDTNLVGFFEEGFQQLTQGLTILEEKLTAILEFKALMVIQNGF